MNNSRRRTTRRAFLSSIAAGVGAVTAGQATAAPADYRDAKADHISISFNRDRLGQYQPSLYFPAEMTIRPVALYAWTSESNNWDLDGHTFIVYYQSQDTDLETTSHRHDREIVQIYTHPEFGEVREAVYSAGHWAAYRDGDPNVLETDSGGEHVKLRVNPQYRHMMTTEKEGNIGIELEPLGTDATLYTDGEQTKFEEFLDEGWDPLLEPGLLQAADRARYADDYWSNEAPWSDRFAATVGRKIAGTPVASYIAPEMQDSEFSN
jgi:hypothetical protein